MKRSKRKQAQYGAWTLIGAGLVILLICALLLCRCGNGDKTVQGTDTATQTVQTETDSQTTGTDTVPEPSDTATETETETETETDSQPPTDTSASQTKRVAITFDDGPHATYTRKITDLLAQYNGHATFFVVGNRVKGDQGKAMAYAYQQGNEIGIHGFTHTVSYATCNDATYQSELSQTDDVIRQYTGETVRVMRPFGGAITQARIKACPYAVVTWNVDSLDWKYKSRSTEAERQKNVDIIVNNIMKSVKDGDIVLMHELYGNSYDALCIVTEKLHAQGYEFVTVSELLGDSLKNGTKYTNANVQ